MLAATDLEAPFRKTTTRGILDFRRRRFMSRRAENQNGRSFPGAPSQFLTSGETAGAEALPRADKAKKVPDTFFSLRLLLSALDGQFPAVAIRIVEP
jgi:hypothetical protein